MRTCFLSYPLTRTMPVYGGAVVDLETAPLKRIEQGDSCNTFRVTFNNHWSTHADTPNHFFAQGRCVTDYPSDFWVFERPQVLDVALGAGELLRWGVIRNQVEPQADILLLRSGWSQKREQDIYMKENPGIHADAGLGLRALGGRLRAVGMDWISVSSFVHREEGRKAHRAFLDPDGEGESLALIEDMDLSADMSGLSQVCVAPFVIDGIDSSPCTVIGVFDD